MIAFRRSENGYVWMGEMESQFGPKTYDGPDGKYREEIVIAHQTEDGVYVGGQPANVTWINYIGDDQRLIRSPGRLKPEDIRPVLEEWHK